MSERTSRPRPLVLLLRTPSAPDAYEQALDEAGYDAQSVPVLGFTYVEAGALRGALERPGDYGGLIVTSSHAVEALKAAHPGLLPAWPAWRDKPAFVVGPATARALAALGLAPRGAEAGQAQALAALIARERPSAAPLLFLCGNRRRDELPQALREAGIPLRELCVYETRARQHIEVDEQPDWVVCFSPSGVEALQAEAAVWARLATCRYAALGPTTAAALEAAGRPAEAVAGTPTPQKLVRALRRAG